MEAVLVVGAEVPGHLQSAAKVPVSKVPKPLHLTQGSTHECTFPVTPKGVKWSRRRGSKNPDCRRNLPEAGLTDTEGRSRWPQAGSQENVEENSSGAARSDLTAASLSAKWKQFGRRRPAEKNAHVPGRVPEVSKINAVSLIYRSRSSGTPRSEGTSHSLIAVFIYLLTHLLANPQGRGCTFCGGALLDARYITESVRACLGLEPELGRRPWCIIQGSWEGF